MQAPSRSPHACEPVDFRNSGVPRSPPLTVAAACVTSHENVLREKGVTEETILAAIRIASVIHGTAAVLDTESAVAPEDIELAAAIL